MVSHPDDREPQPMKVGSYYDCPHCVHARDEEPTPERIAGMAEDLYEDNRPSLEVMRRAPVPRWRELDSDTKQLWIMIARSAWTRGAR